MLLNACKNIDLAVNIGKTKYMEIGRHLDLMANEHTWQVVMLVKN